MNMDKLKKLATRIALSCGRVYCANQYEVRAALEHRAWVENMDSAL